jgi:transcriptional regulator with XRE-family HTH domain
MNVNPLRITGAQIRAARRALEWGQQDLARAAQLSVGTIKAIEANQGGCTCTIDSLNRLIEALRRAGVVLDGSTGGLSYTPINANVA